MSSSAPASALLRRFEGLSGVAKVQHPVKQLFFSRICSGVRGSAFYRAIYIQAICFLSWGLNSKGIVRSSSCDALYLPCQRRQHLQDEPGIRSFRECLWNHPRLGFVTLSEREDKRTDGDLFSIKQTHMYLVNMTIVIFAIVLNILKRNPLETTRRQSLVHYSHKICPLKVMPWRTNFRRPIVSRAKQIGL